jgi:autotransporter-associated beta strand protein
MVITMAYAFSEKSGDASSIERTSLELCLMPFQRIVACILLLSMTHISYGQVINFYWNGTGPVTTNTSWGTNLDGTGTSPTNFIAADQRFNIQNGQTATPGSTWTISGANSGLTVQTGGQVISNFDHSLPLSMQTGAIYSQSGDYGSLSFSSIHPGSTFALSSGTFRNTLVYGGFRWSFTTAQLINANSNFTGNLEQSGSAVLRIATPTVNVGRDLIVDATRSLNLSSATLNLAGNYINSGTVLKNMSTTMNVNFTGTSATATFGTFGTISGTLNFNVAAGNTLTVLDTMNNPSNANIVNSGTVLVGTGGTTGGIAGNMINNGLMIINRSDNYTTSGIISGTGNLQHNGPGRTSLEGSNTYTGTTTINNGVLAINGSHFNAGLYTVNTGGRLEGSTGVVNVNVAGGTISPGNGNGAGIFNISNGLTFSSTSTYAVDILGIDAGGGGYDQIVIGNNGSISLNNANLLVTLSMAPSVNDIFFIIENRTNDPFTTFFNNLPEGAPITIGNYVGNITYQANFSNDSLTGGLDVAIHGLTLSIPEPGSIALIALAGFGILQWYLRKQQKQVITSADETCTESEQSPVVVVAVE